MRHYRHAWNTRRAERRQPEPGAENGTPFVAVVEVDGVERALGVPRLRRVGLCGGSLRSVPSGPAAPPLPSLTRKRTDAP
jgi:hypothetical protein